MSENKENNSKAVKKFTIYFREDEYEYLTEKANEEYLRTGIFIKKLMLETFRKHPEMQDENNPFIKKE